jgi:cyclopropane-fatty-acyl-phospholipid synthase
VPPRKRRVRDDEGIVRLVEALSLAKIDCTLVLPWKQEIHVGRERGAPICKLVLNNERVLRRPLTELSLGRAYVEGDLDIEDFKPEWHATRLFRVRDQLRSGTSPARALQLAGQIALVPPTRSNVRAIEEHYALPPEFFFTFLDENLPLYSQCRWGGRDDITLADAARARLDRVWRSIEPKPGQRILDVGAGWGGLMRYRNEVAPDVHITALTLTEASKKYIKREKLMLDGDEVLVEDILDHRRQRYYDHVVILGVVEHIPTYARLCERVWDALKPGRTFYLDASATRQKYAGSAFIRRYTWPGPHSCLALPDLSQELINYGFAPRRIEDGADDYRRTMRRWALNLEDNAEKITKEWGEYHYRTWRIFLWGGVAAFKTGRLQCYTVIAERLRDQGPRPGALRRATQFAASLRR